MLRCYAPHSVARFALLLLAACTAGGCGMLPVYHREAVTEVAPGNPVPRELEKSSLPTYVLEPPDILLIDAVRVVPKPPITVQTLDVLQITVPPDYTFVEEPIAGTYPVDADGTVNLGPTYGRVDVAGLTLDEVRDAVRKHLESILTDVEVSVSLAESAGKQQIAGEHLIGPDGTVNLGTYGSVFVAGMTLQQAKAAVEMHLSEFLDSPEVSIDVFAYNSKVYYVISEGAGAGDQFSVFPITGNETVLDALAQVQSTTFNSSRNVYVARPAPKGLGYQQILKVDWDAMIRGGQAATNYQLFPGDRVIIEEDRLIALDSMIGKITTPIERLFGVSLLGSQAIQSLNRLPDGGGINNGGGFF